MKEGLEEKIRKIIEEESAVELIREWREMICDLDVPAFNYRYDHVFEAAQIAKHLARETSANYDVAVLGTWLHDVAGPKTWKNYDHNKLGAERARELLLDEGVDAETVDRISSTIATHYGVETPLEILENQIVWEADRLTKIGLTAAIRDIINAVRFHPNLSMHGILERLQEKLKESKEYVDMIITEPGQKIAESRCQNLSTFIELLENELDF